MSALQKVEAREYAAPEPRCVCISGDSQREISVPVNTGSMQFRCRPFVNTDLSQPLAYDVIVNQPGEPANYQPVVDRVELGRAWARFYRVGGEHG
ncbi:hypothetical protein [Martelella alba]|uniref:Uncharacterized protein n=1 Tax=Martelella alba TaxID=2590451 RepID=A0ABY2SHY1_9HYPH|nr:hypothetical protein [Martelella alba]TKI02409.1 hypothetical protein FCN80_25100 [Martelella alba]